MSVCVPLFGLLVFFLFINTINLNPPVCNTSPLFFYYEIQNISLIQPNHMQSVYILSYRICAFIWMSGSYLSYNSPINAINCWIHQRHRNSLYPFAHSLCAFHLCVETTDKNRSDMHTKNWMPYIFWMSRATKKKNTHRANKMRAMWNRTGSDRWHDKETKYERLTKRHTRNHNKLLYYKMRNIIRHPVYYVYFSGLLFDIGLSRFSAVSSVSLTLLENLRANRATEQQIKTTHTYNSNSQEFIITEMCAVLFLQHFSALLFHFLRADVAFWFQVFFYCAFLYC